MSLLGRCAVLFVALVAVTARAEENSAPLESAKQELKKLAGDQKAKSGPTATEGLNTGMPRFQTPTQDLTPYQLTSPEKQENDRKKRNDSEKNWLVNGVEKLERDAKDKDRVLPASQESEPAKEAADLPDRSDPGYLLKAYDEQKRTTEAKQADAKPAHSAQPDPFAPFLQGWLGSSPVRGQFFDAFLKKSDSSAPGVTPLGGSMGISGNRETSGAVGQTHLTHENTTTKANPYLIESNPTTVLKDLSNGAGSLPGPLNPTAMLDQVAARPLSSLLDPLPESPQPSRKPALPALSDDKKYFPQLKKF